MFEENVSLKNHSNYRIGGLARYFLEAKNTEEIIRAVEEARRMKIPVFILGGGTNVLFGDTDFNGFVVKIKNSQIKIEDEGQEFTIVRAGAGIEMNDLVGVSLEKGLSGLEWAAGLPGTLGGAIRGNAGCFGGEIQSLIDEIVSLDVSGPEIKIIRRKGEDCGFGYRSSIFKANKGNEIIIEAGLILKKGEKETLQSISEGNLNYRRLNHPMEHPNIGSIFKNVNLEKIAASRRKTFDSVVKKDPFPVIPTAHLISEAGLKGISFGGAMISPKHPNFIVNILNASASDVKNLIKLAKKEVEDKFNIELEEEIEQLD